MKYEFRKIDSLQIFNYEKENLLNTKEKNTEHLLYVYPVNDYSFCQISYKVIETVNGQKCMIYLKNRVLRNGSIIHFDYYDELDTGVRIKEFLKKNKQLLRESLKYGSFLG